MWVMCDPDPHVGCQLCLLWEWSAVPLPGMAQFGGGGRWWFSASPQLLQCAIFRRAESGGEGESWPGGVELSTPESTHIFLTKGVASPSPLRTLRRVTRQEDAAAEVDGTAGLRLSLARSRSHSGGTYHTSRSRSRLY